MQLPRIIAAGLLALAASFHAPDAARAAAPACAAKWSAATVYTAGMTAQEFGVNYVANYWTQGNDPETSSSGAGTPWTETGICAGCEVKPSVPSGMTAVATSDTKTDLLWQQAAVPLNCKISDYTVFQNGVKVGTTAGNSMAVSSLSASTSYKFSVTATDSVGASAKSTALAVKTLAAGQGAGPTPVFAPYIDMSQTNSENLLTIRKQAGLKAFTLAFVLAPNNTCDVAWGGAGTITKDQMPNGKTILSLVNGMRAAGGDVVISFGGAAGQEAALACTTPASLQKVYQKAITRYKAKYIDFDIEGATASDQPSLTRRDQALVAIRKANPGIVISYTIAVNPTGLDGTGLNVLTSAKADGLNPDLINLMTMDYGPAFDDSSTMSSRAIAAANNTALQIKAAQLTSLVGITPMIGVNDDNKEVFTIADAKAVLAFATPNPDIARLAMWSVNRDNGGCAGGKSASSTCSSLSQSLYEFAKTFAKF